MTLSLTFDLLFGFGSKLCRELPKVNSALSLGPMYLFRLISPTDVLSHSAGLTTMK